MVTVPGSSVYEVVRNAKRVEAYLEEDMRKTSAEVRAIYVELLLPWYINVLAFRAVYLDARSGKVFGDADRQDILAFAEHAGTIAE